jgi:hypothetical protein
MHAAGLACIPGSIMLFGQMFAGAIAKKIGKVKWQATVTAIITTPLLAGKSFSCIVAHESLTNVESLRHYQSR